MFFKVCLLVVGYFVASVTGSVADVVLSCSLVEEGAGMGMFGGMGGGALFTRTAATMVLRDVPTSSDQSPETLTPYVPPASPNPDDLIFESFVTSLEIPEADMLLHADCNEQDVTCEISQYLPHGHEKDTDLTYFIASVQLEGGGVSLSLVLRTVPLSSSGEGSSTPPLMQKKLSLPLSQSGTLLTEVAFLVFSRTQSVMAPIGGDAFLDCGFKLQGPTQPQKIGLEWRLQYRGNGRRILEMKAEEEEEAAVVVEREGSHVDPALVLGEGNVSLSLLKLMVSDEGTYICSVNTGLFQAQQVLQLQIVQPPQVYLSENEVVFKDTQSPQRVSCHCERYYPLDVQVEWLSLPPTESEPTPLSKQISLSSHRQYSDGTFSLSSHLTLYPSDYVPGTKVTCQVSHQSMTTPVSVDLTVLTSEPDQSCWMILGCLAATVLFFYRLLG